MADNFLLSPPIVFFILLVVLAGISYLLRGMEFKPKNVAKGATKSYASGEDLPDHMIQPDYSQFFPFAFFFTILHVVALMVTTVPIGNLGTYAIAVVYIIGAIVGLFVLYRR